MIKHCFRSGVLSLLLSATLQPMQLYNAIKDVTLARAADVIDLIGINTKDDHGRTVLHYAAEHEDTILMVFLLDNGGDYTVRDNSGETPCGIAERLDNYRIVEVFLMHYDLGRLGRKIGHRDLRTLRNPVS